MNKYKVVYITSSRADYGIVRKYLDFLNRNENIDLSITVTGSLLEKEYGEQYKLIERDGFKIDKKIKLPISTKSNLDIINSMADTLKAFGEYFAKRNFDLVIILGDRYEMLPVTIAAAMQRKKIIHIHGGEETFGNYDEFIRHSITKMSNYHFTSCEIYRNRVIQLGEKPINVFNLGSLGAENAKHIDETLVIQEAKELKKKKYFVVLVHPETLTKANSEKQVKVLLKAIDKYKDDYQFVFLGSNADTKSYIFRNNIKKYVANNKEQCLYFENVNTDSYHYLLKNSICLIGNSSSGIIEAPSLNIYTINIGRRQDGRVQANSVINVGWNQKEISSSFEKVIKTKKLKVENPYLKRGNTALNYCNQTLKILKNSIKNKDNVKEFYDLF